MSQKRLVVSRSSHVPRPRVLWARWVVRVHRICNLLALQIRAGSSPAFGMRLTNLSCRVVPSQALGDLSENANFGTGYLGIGVVEAFATRSIFAASSLSELARQRKV